MPGMDGSQFLEEVKSRYPQTMRVVLSGQASREALLRSIAPSHQSLAKPCNIEELKERIVRAFLLHDSLQRSAIKNVVAGLSSVPSLPAYYNQVVSEIQSPDPSVGRIAAIISQDPAMTAKVLQLANSALLGVLTHVSDAVQAVSLIGLEMLRALVITVHIFSQFENERVKELDIAQLWKHSLATARVARAIAQAEGAPKSCSDDCFTAGLLHDIGKLILMSSLPEKYRSVMAQVVKDRVSLLKAEQDAFQCTHAEVGAYLIAIWGLPRTIVEAVAWHHLPSTAPAKNFGATTAVHVADSLLSSGPFHHLALEEPLDSKHLEQIGLAHQQTAWRQVCQESIDTFKEAETDQ